MGYLVSWTYGPGYVESLLDILSMVLLSDVIALILIAWTCWKSREFNMIWQFGISRQTFRLNLAKQQVNNYNSRFPAARSARVRSHVIYFASSAVPLESSALSILLVLLLSSALSKSLRQL